MAFQGIPENSLVSEPSGPLLRRTTVLTVSQRVISRSDRPPLEGERQLSSGLAVAGGSIVLPGLRAEERLLLGLVDGRLSIARLAGLSGLSEDATIQHLRALCSRRVLVPVEAKEVTIRGKGAEPLFRLGPYEVSSRIGQGGMGSVYAGRRTGAVGFHRLFAIKVVRQDSGQEQAAERSFIREVQIGSWLDHPNTQSVVDVGTYKNQPYLVLQFVEGTNLEELSFGRRVPPDILLTVLVDVLRGLQSAHELSDDQGKWLGLVHGDVSPPNILVGTDGVARLTDFGSARFTALGETGQADPTNLGKPAFMAPEQLYVEPLDARTDIFAVGAMMWTALTGHSLFSADSYEQIITNVLQKEIAPPSAHGAPPCLDEICLRALSRPREGRYASAEEMSQALLRVGLTNDLIAPPTAVGAYVRRELSGTDAALRRRVDLAYQDATEIPPTVAMPLSGAAEPQPSGLNLAQTMVIPGRSQQAEAKGPGGLEVLRGVLRAAGARRRMVIASLVAIGVLGSLLTVAIARHAGGGLHQDTRSSPPPADTHAAP
jgi:eukaryotic-like serine/threonine-protein kinase